MARLLALIALALAVTAITAGTASAHQCWGQGQATTKAGVYPSYSIRGQGLLVCENNAEGVATWTVKTQVYTIGGWVDSGCNRSQTGQTPALIFPTSSVKWCGPFTTTCGPNKNYFYRSAFRVTHHITRPWVFGPSCTR